MRNFKLFLLIGTFFFQTVFLSSFDIDFHFKGEYPPVRIITINENSQTYNIEAVSGHVIAIFRPSISHSEAVQYIQSLNGKIIGQTISVRCYLIDVGAGNESLFINRLKNHSGVKFAFLNAVEYPCAVTPQTVVMDNFYMSHGNNVSFALQECGLTTKISQYNVGINGTNKVLPSKIYNVLYTLLKDTPDATPLVINMSFGPGFSDPNIKYWTDKNITDDIKKSYIKVYKESMKSLIAVVSNYSNKDFVIVKSAGNRGLKSLDAEILNDLAGELTEEDFMVLNDHFILVGAEDTRDSAYSNTVSYGNYNFLYTSVDISDLRNDNGDLSGTSYAAPRVSCFISSTVDEHGIKATEALKVIRDITYRNPQQPLNQKNFEQEAKRLADEYNSQQNKNDSLISSQSAAFNNYREGLNNEKKYTDDKDFKILFLDESSAKNKYQFEGGRAIVIVGYTGTETDIYIPPKIQDLPVIAIGEAAFFHLFISKQLTSVTIPDSVTSIGNSAFVANHLTSVIIPDSVKRIEYRAFAENRLTSITIPDSVTHIGYHAFAHNQLNIVTISNSVKKIEDSAFAYNRLSSVTIPDGVTEIEGGAFANNRLTGITIPNGVKKIGDSAFAYNRLTNVTIPDGVTEICGGVFENNRLTSVTIPNSVTEIGYGAFANNQLTTVKIGKIYGAILLIGIGKGFDKFYDDGGRRAGTYSFNGNYWSLE